MSGVKEYLHPGNYFLCHKQSTKHLWCVYFMPDTMPGDLRLFWLVFMTFPERERPIIISFHKGGNSTSHWLKNWLFCVYLSLTRITARTWARFYMISDLMIIFLQAIQTLKQYQIKKVVSLADVNLFPYVS